MKDLILLMDKLGLTGMKTQLTEVMSLGNEPYTSTVIETLKKLLTAECEHKKSRSLYYRLQLARFPSIKLLSDSSQAKLVENIDIQKVVDNRENIMFIGGSGSAKTHLAIGLAFTAIERGYRVRFYTLNELATQLLNARVSLSTKMGPANCTKMGPLFLKFFSSWLPHFFAFWSYNLTQ